MLVMLSIALAGCDSGKKTSISSEAETNDADESTSQGYPDDTLAVVNGSAITEAQVQFSLENNFDFTTQHTGGEKLRKSILDSLIASEVIKQHAQSELSSDTLEQIRLQAAAYENELFIKEYLSAKIKPEPVSAKMVEEYYNQNPDKFGGAQIKTFELLKTTKEDETARDQFLAEIPVIRQSEDWKTVSSKWKEKLGLTYQRAEAVPGVLIKELKTLVDRLKVGESSDAAFIKGNIHLIRVTDVRTIAPKPLVQFKTQIRESLAPMQLRDAIKKVSDQLIENAEIQYIDDQG